MAKRPTPPSLDDRIWRNTVASAVVYAALRPAGETAESAAAFAAVARGARTDQRSYVQMAATLTTLCDVALKSLATAPDETAFEAATLLAELTKTPDVSPGANRLIGELLDLTLSPSDTSVQRHLAQYQRSPQDDVTVFEVTVTLTRLACKKHARSPAERWNVLGQFLTILP